MLLDTGLKEEEKIRFKQVDWTRTGQKSDPSFTTNRFWEKSGKVFNCIPFPSVPSIRLP